MSKFVNHKVAQMAARNPPSKFVNIEQRQRSSKILTKQNIQDL